MTLRYPCPRRAPLHQAHSFAHRAHTLIGQLAPRGLQQLTGAPSIVSGCAKGSNLSVISHAHDRRPDRRTSSGLARRVSRRGVLVADPSVTVDVKPRELGSQEIVYRESGGPPDVPQRLIDGAHPAIMEWAGTVPERPEKIVFQSARPAAGQRR